MRPVFGDVSILDAAPVPMAYVVVASCGHVRAVVKDTGPMSAQEAADAAMGMTVEHRPAVDALANGSCSICEPGTMEGMFTL
jgi:hypothetical protein